MKNILLASTALIGSACLSQAAFIFTNPTSVTSSAGSATDVGGVADVSNLANGVGLDTSVDPPTHDTYSLNTSWVTDGSGIDFFASNGPVTLTIDLGSDTEFSNFVTWAYGLQAGSPGFKVGNNVKDFSLQFATDADGTGGFGTSITFNPSFVQPESAIFANGDAGESEAVLYGLGQTVNARYIEMTITDNYFGEAGFLGGERLGLGAVAVAIPEPSSTALIGLGGLSLLFRRRK